MKTGQRLLALLGLTALAAGGAIAYASIPAADGRIDSCYDKKGNLRVVDPAAGDACKKNETALSWNQRGPQGPPGPRGPQGAPGIGGAVTLEQGTDTRTFTSLCADGVGLGLPAAFRTSTRPRMLMYTMNVRNRTGGTAEYRLEKVNQQGETIEMDRQQITGTGPTVISGQFFYAPGTPAHLTVTGISPGCDSAHGGWVLRYYMLTFPAG